MSAAPGWIGVAFAALAALGGVAPVAAQDPEPPQPRQDPPPDDSDPLAGPGPSADPLAGPGVPTNPLPFLGQVIERAQSSQTFSRVLGERWFRFEDPGSDALIRVHLSINETQDLLAVDVRYDTLQAPRGRRGASVHTQVFLDPFGRVRGFRTALRADRQETTVEGRVEADQVAVRVRRPGQEDEVSQGPFPPGAIPSLVATFVLPCLHEALAAGEVAFLQFDESSLQITQRSLVMRPPGEDAPTQAFRELILYPFQDREVFQARVWIDEQGRILRVLRHGGGVIRPVTPEEAERLLAERRERER
jgi:hypothetical protein